MSSAITLTPDAEAILLLCGHFKSSLTSPKPLTTREYNHLSLWLGVQGLHPGELVEAYDELNQLEGFDLDWERVGRLLERGPALALAVERWFNHGLWIITRVDDDYPPRIKANLPHAAPPILYGTGDKQLLIGHARGLAIVGSRDVDEPGAVFAERIARQAAGDNIIVISGGARGVDMLAMQAALDVGGAAVGALADNLNRAAVSAEFREAIRDQRLTLFSPFTPEAGFNVGNAMARNKLVYTLANWAVVVSSSPGQGGTWAGATENLKHGWSPLFVYAGPEAAEGNLELIQKGGLALDPALMRDDQRFRMILDELANSSRESRSDTTATELDGEAAFQADDPIFQAIWPLIEERLATPLKLRELLGQLGPSLKQSQLKAWLDEAERRGLVERAKITAPYQLPHKAKSDGPLQLCIFQIED